MITAAELLERMSPRTLISLLADLDDSPDVGGFFDDESVNLMYQAASALVALVGEEAAIGMLAAADVAADNPVILDALCIS